MVNNILMLSFFIFISVAGFLLSEIAGLSFALINPLALLAILVLIGVAIAAGNTPVVKGIAVAAIFGVISISFISTGFIAVVDPLIFGAVFGSIFLVMGFIFIEMAKG